MRSFVVVPANHTTGNKTPSNWPRITASGNQLDLPGAGSVRMMHAYALAWCLVEHDDCAGGSCFATFVPGADCCHGSVGADGPFWIDDRHFHAVDIAIATRMPSGTFEMFIVRGGSDAAAEIQRPFMGENSGADYRLAIAARGNEICVKYEPAALPNSRLTQSWIAVREIKAVVADTTRSLCALLREHAAACHVRRHDVVVAVAHVGEINLTSGK